VFLTGLCVQAGEATDNALRGIEEEVNVFAKPDAAKAACPPAQLLVPPAPSPIRNHPPPYDPPTTLGIGLR